MPDPYECTLNNKAKKSIIVSHRHPPRYSIKWKKCQRPLKNTLWCGSFSGGKSKSGEDYSLMPPMFQIQFFFKRKRNYLRYLGIFKDTMYIDYGIFYWWRSCYKKSDHPSACFFFTFHLMRHNNYFSWPDTISH